MVLSPRSERTRVLVCEDTDDTRFLLGEMLRAHGFEVVEVATGIEAVERVFAGGIDVALIDIGLPDMNGHEVARRIRHSAMRDIQLIALTGYGSASDRESSRLSGFDHHLLKPVRGEELVAAISAAR